MAEMKLDMLPEDCIVSVLSCTSPCDAGRFWLVSSAVRDAAESDVLWERFLPFDYPDILSRLVSPLAFTSKKDLFQKLSSPLLIDGGQKTFSIDKSTNKKCYMLSARELSITWGSNPLYWCWKRLLQSRFPEGVELVMVCWLEICGMIRTRMLSPNTIYGAYLIFKLAGRAFGLDTLPSEVAVEVGNHQSRGKVYLRQDRVGKQQVGEALWRSNRVPKGEKVVSEREDGWLQIELGEFYHDGSDKEVKMSLREVKGDHLKGGLIVEGIELRPKSSQ